jgi:ribonuclease D
LSAGNPDGQSVSYELITTDRQLTQVCGELADAPDIAFDTEFVSEHTFRPQLCLAQVAAADRLLVIDTLGVRDMRPFWELLAGAGHNTIVHAGREELLFCLGAIDRRPTRLFDVQIAAGLVGFEYPAGYGSLMYKLLGQRPHKGETRTDWRRRPLSEQQLEYALDDVRYLAAMRDRLVDKLKALGRSSWLDAEMNDWQDEIDAGRSRERWWRVSGISGLSSRSLAIVREVCRWRDAEAERRDWPARRVLRDDLIIELAKRRTADLKQIRALRGLERGDLQRAMPNLAEAIGKALALADGECPQPSGREAPSQLNLLGQFLSSALTSICRSASVASSIVGTASDVRELIAYHLRLDGYCDKPPHLGQGWRAEVVGNLIEDLLSGKMAIRIKDPLAEEPLSFERLPETTGDGQRLPETARNPAETAQD